MNDHEKRIQAVMHIMELEDSLAREFLPDSKLEQSMAETVAALRDLGVTHAEASEAAGRRRAGRA